MPHALAYLRQESGGRSAVGATLVWAVAARNRFSYATRLHFFLEYSWKSNSQFFRATA